VRWDVAGGVERSREWVIQGLDNGIRVEGIKNESLLVEGTDGVGLRTNKVA